MSNILQCRTWQVRAKDGERTTWYTPLRFLKEYKSVTYAEHFNTMSSCGDWDGLLVQNVNKRWYVIPFYQENKFGYFLLTTLSTFIELQICPTSKELCEIYDMLQLMYAYSQTSLHPLVAEMLLRAQTLCFTNKIFKYMRTFDFLYNADGKIAEGREVVYYPTKNWYDEPKIVTLAGYNPYFTDGQPDPKNADECEEWCQIEVCGDVDDIQIRLEDLYELKKYEGEASLLYNGCEVEVIGTFEYIEGETKYAFKVCDVLKFEDEKYIEERNELSDLDEEQLEWFYNHCVHVSIYISDYQNNLGIEVNEASDIADDWFDYIYNEEKENTFEEFKHWVASL